MKENKRVIVDWKTPKLKQTYEKLSSKEPIRKRIDKAIEKIKKNPGRAGNPIPHKIIPKEYKEFPNAFHLKLSKKWRLIYSITGINEVEILAIILDWFDNHKDYEKKFKYKVR
jgi:hypothetical protein